jgi:glutathione S-transferase
LKTYPRDPQTRAAPPEYKALHLQGTAPTITEGDFALAETGAVIAYVMAKHGKGRLEVAPEAPHFAAYVYWLHFVSGSLEGTSTLAFVAASLGANPEAARRFDERVDRAYRMIDTRLGEVPYLAGPALTLADIMIVYPLTTVRAAAKRSLADYPNIRAYLKRIGERPAFRRATEKSDPGKKPNLE